jgi:hypothetical protein
VPPFACLSFLLLLTGLPHLWDIPVLLMPDTALTAGNVMSSTLRPGNDKWLAFFYPEVVFDGFLADTE